MKNIADKRQQIEKWLTDWELCIRKADYKSARNLFAPNVFSFGTHTLVADGLSALEKQQWRHIWSVTSGFHFDIPSARLAWSEDHSVVIVMVCWSSTGYDNTKSPFIRNGRATIVLTCQVNSLSWRAIHTHFSLAPCTAHSQVSPPTHSATEPSPETSSREVIYPCTK